MREWDKDLPPKTMWYDKPEWFLHENVWTDSVKQKCTFGKYNEAIKEAAKTAEDYLKSVYKTSGEFGMTEEEAIDFFKNPKRSIGLEMERQNMWEEFLLYVFQIQPYNFPEDKVHTALQTITEITYAIDNRSLPMQLQ